MKLKITLAACLYSVAAVFSLNAVAASDTPPDAQPAAEKEPAGMTKKTKPHSHMEEKLGVVSKAVEATPGAMPARQKPAMDKSKHFHPRDGGKL